MLCLCDCGGVLDQSSDRSVTATTCSFFLILCLKGDDGYVALFNLYAHELGVHCLGLSVVATR